MTTSEMNFKVRGDLKEKDLKFIKKRLTSSEKIKFIASYLARGGNVKHITILTNERVILLKKGKIKLFGQGVGFKGIPYHSIADVEVEVRKKYDLLVVHLRDSSTKRFMTPKNTGAELTSRLRRLQTLKKRKEKRGETPLKKLEKLSDLKERDIISDERFEEKKKKLLKEI